MENSSPSSLASRTRKALLVLGMMMMKTLQLVRMSNWWVQTFRILEA